MCPRGWTSWNITDEVIAAVAGSGIREGLCLVNAMHITSSVFINDDEPELHEDYKRWLETLAPFDPSSERYHHNRTGEDNGDAHHRRQVIGPRGSGRRDQWQARLRPVGANLLRGIRWPPPQACTDQSDR